MPRGSMWVPGGPHLGASTSMKHSHDRRRYDHKYPSCVRTYVALAVYSKALDARSLTKALGLRPSRTMIAGQLMSSIGTPRIAKWNGWFFSSQRKCLSRDLRAHLDFVLDRIAPAKEALERLLHQDCEAHLSAFWDSAAGNGGPLRDHRIIARLAEFPLELHFDIWFSGR